MSKVKLIQTGGTIDKEYNLLNGELYFTQSNIPDMLKRARSTVEINFFTMKLLDSLDMNDEYRRELLEHCKNCEEDKIIISHGTDTMVDSAAAIAELKLNKTIVLFGAMIPFKIDYSDALFNLGSAITSVQLAATGVYIAMNGQLFRHDNVVKNREKGEFEVL
ncbi:MAG: asparaginase [Gammaproteobacteria bacterium]|nr:asparaginase [Gammaproteobacteria bacterium]